MLPYKLPVVCDTCIPANPFYLKWINQYGGYDYWMFQKRQTLELSQGDVQTFSPYIADYQAATGTDRLLGKSVEEQLTIGAQSLSVSEWRAISYLAKSSFIQWYDRDKSQWLDVLVDKSKIVMQTDDGLHSIELTLLLPAPQLAV